MCTKMYEIAVIANCRALKGQEDNQFFDRSILNNGPGDINDRVFLLFL